MRRTRTLTACLCALVLVVAACADDADGDDAAPATEENGAATGTTEGGEAPPPTEGVGVETLPPVGVGDEADFGAGLFATVTNVESVDLEAAGPRDTTGPGIVVTLEVRNGGDEVVDLGGLAMNVRYGADATPASLSQAAPEPILEGSLDPGESRSGNFAFRVPGEGLAPLVVEVHHAGSPHVVIVDAGDALG